MSNPTPEEVAAKLSEAQRDTLEDLCGCPGLFAGQYFDLDRLPHALVARSYGGAAGFLGLARAEPSTFGIEVRNLLRSQEKK